jgi:CHRD domain
MRKLIAVLITGSALVVVAVAVATTYKVKATLTPGADVPRPKGAAHAKGSFVGSYVENKQGGAVLKATLTFSGLTGQAMQAHIHSGKPGVAGNVIVALCGPCTSGKTGTYKISKAIVEKLESGNTYVNLHTAKNPAGEIRGQIKVTG